MTAINKIPQAMQGLNATRAVSGQYSAGVSGGAQPNNPFSAQLFKGETSGLNNMQIGDVVNTPAQAGKAAGISRLLYNA